MKILHLLAAGEIGGIETLVKNYDEYSKHENLYFFVWKGGIIADELKARGRKTIILNKTNRHFFEIFSAAEQVCKKERIQAVIVHHEAPLLKLLMLGLKVRVPNLTVLAYAHAHADIICDTSKAKGLAIRKFVQRIGFSSADGVIAISDIVAKSLKNLIKIQDGKIKILYNGIPLKKYKDSYSKEKKDAFYVTYVGRLSKEKGVQNILKMFSALSEHTLERIKLQIVGDGPYRKALEDMVKEEKLSCVSFLGNRTDVAEILKGSHCFVHFPACEEGFGIAIVEAMAAGNVCICLNRGAVGEILKHHESGYILEELNPTQLEELLLSVMENYETEEIANLRKNAIKQAAEFDIEQFTRQLDEYVVTMTEKKNSK